MHSIKIVYLISFIKNFFHSHFTIRNRNRNLAKVGTGTGTVTFKKSELEPFLTYFLSYLGLQYTVCGGERRIQHSDGGLPSGKAQRRPFLNTFVSVLCPAWGLFYVELGDGSSEEAHLWSFCCKWVLVKSSAKALHKMSQEEAPYNERHLWRASCFPLQKRHLWAFFGQPY